jgi:hypothetical protein
MEKGIISKHSDLWRGHPDVAYFKGQLYVVFREADRHTTQSTTSIHISKKVEGTWTSQLIFESDQRLNCPRLSVIGDALWLICDEVKHGRSYIEAENNEQNTKILLWKTADGQNWTCPIRTNITGIVPDRICKTENGYIIATHILCPLCPLGKKHLVQNVWHATDLEGEWTKHTLCHDNLFNLCEASITPFNGGYLCLMRENSALGLPAFKAFSHNGIMWQPPIKTRLFACHRPVIGVLASGKILTTYRESSFSSASPGYWAKNTFACVTTPESALTDFKESVILPLDHDKSKRSDSGYTGWVQLPNGNIFIVNYITNEAKKAHVVWYEISEEDF